MNDVFSDYLRRLMASGEPPGQDDYDEVRGHLRALVITELRRRGLWTSPPDYVGVPAGSWRDDGALDELVDDAYSYIFVNRLGGMTQQLKVKPNIRGLVSLNVRNFITDRQRKADPLGFRIYNRLRKAIERLLKLGRIFLRGEPVKIEPSDGAAPKVDNASVLVFDAGLTHVTDPRDLEAPVSRWNDDLMPELVTAEGRSVPEVVEALAENVATLPDDNVQTFRFQHLAKALKDDARCRWQVLWQLERETAPEDGEPNAPQVPYVVPDPTPDWPRFRAVVLACVEQTIGAVGQALRQRHLWTVWLFLRSSRIDSETPREVPNHSQLGRQLDIPRERVGQILNQLKGMVRTCIDSAGSTHKSPDDAEHDHPAAAHRAGARRR